VLVYKRGTGGDLAELLTSKQYLEGRGAEPGGALWTKVRGDHRDGEIKPFEKKGDGMRPACLEKKGPGKGGVQAAILGLRSAADNGTMAGLQGGGVNRGDEKRGGGSGAEPDKGEDPSEDSPMPRHDRGKAGFYGGLVAVVSHESILLCIRRRASRNGGKK